VNLNDVTLAGLSRTIKTNVRLMDELAAQGKTDELDEALKAIAKAADESRVRLAQIESGL
jgi:hypothetical protein